MSILNTGVRQVSVKGGNLVAAGEKADADTTDSVIETAGFERIEIDNDGPADLRLAIGEDVTTATAIIIVPAGRSYESALRGSDLHYCVDSGETVFRFVLAGA